MPICFRDKMRATANGASEGDKELNQEGDRVGLRVGLERAHEPTGKPMERTGIEQGRPKVRGGFVRWNRAAHL